MGTTQLATTEFNNLLEFRDSKGQNQSITAYITSPGGCQKNNPGWFGPFAWWVSGCGLQHAASVGACLPSDDDSGPVDGVVLWDGEGCFAIPGRSEPDITLSASPRGFKDENGDPVPMEEAKFTPTLTQKTSAFGPRTDIPVWTISSVAVEGGAGYRGGETVRVSIASPAMLHENRPRSEARGDVKVGGALLSVIADKSGTPTGVKIEAGGLYYKERIDLPAYTYPIFANRSSGLSGPLLGDTTKITAIVDDQPTSPTFGNVVDLRIDNGGSPFIAWQRNFNQSHTMSGVPIPLRARNTRPLVSFEADACFGSGVCVTVEAVETRAEPTDLRFDGTGMCSYSSVTRAGGQVGCGGSFTPTFEMELEDDDPTKPVWKLTGLAASGGELYGGFNKTAGPAVFYDDPQTGERLVQRGPHCGVRGRLPNYTLSINPPVTVAKFGDLGIPTTYQGGVITGATITDPGAFYQYRDYMGEPVPVERLTLTLRGSGYAELGRVEPTLTVAASQEMGGSGVTLSPTLGTGKDDCGRDYWFVEGIKVSGGAGYASSGRLKITAANGDWTDEPAAATLDINEEGVPTLATVTSPGKYWRVSKDAEPYVAELTSRVIQLPPSKGEGAKISFEVNKDPYSPRFGEVAKVKVIDGGSGYITLGQAGCTYGLGSFRGTPTLTLSRDKTSLIGQVGDAEVLMLGPGLGPNDCESGEVSLSPVAVNGSGAFAKWPASLDAPCGTDLYCPQPTSLFNACVTAVWTSPTGRQITMTTRDAVEVSGGLYFYFYDLVPVPDQPGAGSAVAAGANLFIDLRGGVLGMQGAAAVYPLIAVGRPGIEPVPLPCQTCYLTATSCASKLCGTGTWWNGTYDVPLEWTDTDPCPCFNAGNFRVTISTPPRSKYQPC